jgi:hypothetical protein
MALDRPDNQTPVEQPAPAKAKKINLQAVNCNLMEPTTQQWFKDGVPTEVYELTEWLKCQIEAGLLTKL